MFDITDSVAFYGKMILKDMLLELGPEACCGEPRFLQFMAASGVSVFQRRTRHGCAPRARGQLAGELLPDLGGRTCGQQRLYAH
jgi:hypothetical protein